MTSIRPAHPLDVDIADVVDGFLDDARAAPIEAHLAECLLCRVKRLRLAGAPPPPPGGAALPSPAFVVPTLDDTAEPAPSELWLAGGDERILVVVLRVTGERVLVAPITFDVEAADDEAVIIDAAYTSLGTSVVLYPSLATELPRSFLVGRVPGRVDGPMIDSAPEPRGTPIAGADDPRLELRQHLADRLGSLEDTPPDPTTDAPGVPTEQVRSTLIADLRAMRGHACTVRPLDAWPDLVVADRDGWTPLATVDEIGVVLVVLDTPHGLADAGDFDAARAVLTRFNASALVVLAGSLSDTAEVFDASSLNQGIDLPSGAHTPPRPLIGGLAAFDAIAKFADQRSGARAMSPPTRGPIARVDVADVLRAAASVATADAVRQGSRFKINPKRRGYESLADAPDALGAALAGAFTNASVVDALLGVARRKPDDG